MDVEAEVTGSPVCTGRRVRVQRGTLIDDLLKTSINTDGWQPGFYDLRDWEGQATPLYFHPQISPL
jgi:hypothetical protein